MINSRFKRENKQQVIVQYFDLIINFMCIKPQSLYAYLDGQLCNNNGLPKVATFPHVLGCTRVESKIYIDNHNNFTMLINYVMNL